MLVVLRENLLLKHLLPVELRPRAKKERAKVKEDQVVLLEPGLPLSRQLVERRSKSRKNHKKRLKRKKQPVLLKKSVLKKSKMPTKTRKRPKQGL
jgi:hypothetical protein